MHDLQGMIFRTVSHWSAASALVVFLLGVLFSLQGYRFARILLALTSAAGGFISGGAVAALLETPPEGPAGALALVFGLLSVLRPRVGLALASGFVFCGFAIYLTTRVSNLPEVALAAAGIGFAAGIGLLWVVRRSLAIMITVMEGAALMVIGFVATTSALAPPLAQTFRDWADSFTLLVPTMLGMFCVLGYSVQANSAQGDIRAGGGKSWNSATA